MGGTNLGEEKPEGGSRLSMPRSQIERNSCGSRRPLLKHFAASSLRFCGNHSRRSASNGNGKGERNNELISSLSKKQFVQTRLRVDLDSTLLPRSHIDRDQPVSAVATMEEVVEASEGQLRLMMRLLGVLAVAATFLAAAGLYAVISYSVIQRTRELGIRRALGAQPSDILYLVVRHGLGLSLAGVVLGLGAAFVLTGVMKGMLFQVSAADRATFGVISILFIVASLVASYIPARRAVSINPLIALRVG